MSDGTEAVKALSWKQTRRIVDRFAPLNPYDHAIVPGSILNIVGDINRDSAGRQRQLYGYGISAKRYALYARDDSRLKLIRASEHGLGLYYRPKEGRDSDCEVALWKRRLGVDCESRPRAPMGRPGLVSLARHEANRNQHTKCDESASKAGPRQIATVQLRFISGRGKSDWRSGHTVSAVRERSFTLDDDAAHQHSRRNNPHSGQSNAASIGPNV
jgi:hypothetical protein